MGVSTHVVCRHVLTWVCVPMLSVVTYSHGCKYPCCQSSRTDMGVSTHVACYCLHTGLAASAPTANRPLLVSSAPAYLPLTVSACVSCDVTACARRNFRRVRANGYETSAREYNRGNTRGFLGRRPDAVTREMRRCIMGTDVVGVCCVFRNQSVNKIISKKIA